jgi:hypothetical protein
MRDHRRHAVMDILRRGAANRWISVGGQQKAVAGSRGRAALNFHVKNTRLIKAHPIGRAGLSTFGKRKSVLS